MYITGLPITPMSSFVNLRKQIECYCQLGDRVIDQARRRVLEGEPVPNPQKIYSIFELPHRPDQARQGANPG